MTPSGSLDNPDNSLWFELRSLADFLEETTISDCMLVWLNDNEASTHVACYYPVYLVAATNCIYR